MINTPSNTPQRVSRFELGELCYTPGAQDVLNRYQVNPFDLIARHVRGDWGAVCPEDAQANEEALRFGARLMSVYELPAPPLDSATRDPAKVWLITEADRSVTTILLPEEY